MRKLIPAKRKKRKKRIATKPAQHFLSPEKVHKMLAKQAASRETRRRYKAASLVRDKFHPRKSDYGNLVFVTSKGKRSDSSKGRKGHLVYVSQNGNKKYLVKETYEPYRLKRIHDISPPKNRLKKQLKAFERRRLVRKASGKSVVKGSGSVGSKSSTEDFSSYVVSKIAKSIHKTLTAQSSQRVFLISLNILIEEAAGKMSVVRVQVPIQRADHISIRLGGIRNFVTKKIYAYIAKELLAMDLVTTGSSNHIHSLDDNEGVEEDALLNSQGEEWAGVGKAVVRIKTIEWKIEQSK